MSKTLIASLLVLAVSGSANASLELATKNKCNICHTMDKKLVGPTWKDVAAKNKGRDPADLAAYIPKGGKDKYGKIPMPPQPQAKDDAAALAKWILSL